MQKVSMLPKAAFIYLFMHGVPCSEAVIYKWRLVCDLAKQGRIRLTWQK